MATVTKTVLKTYFEQGDIPTQAQYVDLIDSQFGLGEVGTTQIIQGTISASAAKVEYISLKKLYIPGLGISDNVTTTDRKGVKVGSTFTIGKTLEVVGDINTTGNISASGDILAANLILKDGLSNSFGNIHINTTAFLNGIYTNNTGSFIADTTQIYVGSTNPGPSQINFATQDHPNTLNIIKGHITASGNISSSGDVTADKVFFRGQDSTADYLSHNGTGLIYKGHADIIGTLNADGLDIDGNADISGNLAVGGGVTFNNVNSSTISWAGNGSYQSSDKRNFILKITSLPELDLPKYIYHDEIMTILNSQVTLTSTIIITRSNAENAEGESVHLLVSIPSSGRFTIRPFSYSRTTVPAEGITSFNIAIL